MWQWRRWLQVFNGPIVRSLHFWRRTNQCLQLGAEQTSQETSFDEPRFFLLLFLPPFFHCLCLHSFNEWYTIHKLFYGSFYIVFAIGQLEANTLPRCAAHWKSPFWNIWIEKQTVVYIIKKVHSHKGTWIGYIHYWCCKINKENKKNHRNKFKQKKKLFIFDNCWFFFSFSEQKYKEVARCY